ncbi:hypothetical protein Y032_0270g864 [Ancylostoma ceylanicum]|uniref:Uncharacterized protein n=1 Tax=Ancylostoma ceylanicum TaxID=53326 RepID=A0A016S9M6_9BILA|nr:hypothetical protein Y032_0270g864 [Ancylostoma ceylanicum]
MLQLKYLPSIRAQIIYGASNDGVSSAWVEFTTRSAPGRWVPYPWVISMMHASLGDQSRQPQLLKRG